VGAGDPLVGYGPDGSLIVVALGLADIAWYNTTVADTTRLTAPTWEEAVEGRMGRDGEGGEVAPAVEDVIGGSENVSVARSEDDGASWSTTLIPGFGGDKVAFAIDTSEESPYRGNVYVAFNGPGDRLGFARSTDCGRTFEPARVVGRREDCGWAWLQVGVAADGAVHLVWHWAWRRVGGRVVMGPGDRSEAALGIFDARSDDGGVTFSEPVAVGLKRGTGVVWPLSAAIAPSGALLVVWNEGDRPPRCRGDQPRTTLQWIHSEDGQRWSEAAPLYEVGGEVAQGFPVVAATDDGWHVLSYDAGRAETAVRVYSAAQSELIFRPTRDLARRGFGADQIFLAGNMQLRTASDIVIAGDYVGFDGAGSGLVAGIVLPESDEPRSRLTAYAAVFDE
jgi:hypothetical protein